MFSMLSNLFMILQTDSVLLRHEKVYSILAIILVVFTAFIVLLLFTQKKVSDLEEKINDLD